MTNTEEILAAPNGPVFEVTNGSIAFGGNQALEAVSFGMTKGQLVGLIGPNGSGKTTLLNATSGVSDRPNISTHDRPRKYASTRLYSA